MEAQDVPNSVLLDAVLLKKQKCIQQNDVKYTIIDILQTINEQIRHAHETGLFFVVTTIPSSIYRDASGKLHRMVCAKIIETLVAKNYRVTVCSKDGIYKLLIKWMSIEEELEEDHYTSVIRQHQADF